MGSLKYETTERIEESELDLPEEELTEEIEDSMEENKEIADLPYREITDEELSERRNGVKISISPLYLEDYPDDYLFKTRDLARFMGIESQQLRNYLTAGIDDYIRPQKTTSGQRLFTKEQMKEFKALWDTWKNSNMTLKEVIKMSSQEMAHVVMAPDEMAAANQMANAVKEWMSQMIISQNEEISKMLNVHSSALLEDKQSMEEIIKSNQEIREELKRQSDILEKQMEANKVQEEEIKKLKEELDRKQKQELEQEKKRLEEENEKLKEALQKKKKFGFFGIKK